ncbi:hypothetical protein R3P38DRAFT_2859570 [Favolaschia claudopus]|uniref:Uncharacterized protein n=1 Tax=Favolaschia claudopus TaxID=2862362 RepID=A0AAW0DLP0_9AGAR
MSLTSISSVTRYYVPRTRHRAPTLGFFDLFSPMVTGLALRVVIDAATFQNVKLSPALIGLYEGIVLLYYVKNRTRFSWSVYVAYTIRVLVDFFVTENVFRLVVVLLWTTMGMVLADVAPAAWTETGAKRQWRRFRHDLSRSLRVLFTQGPTAMASESAAASSSTPLRTRPPKRPVPGTFPGAEWSETDTRAGTATEDDDAIYDPAIYDEGWEEDEVSEMDSVSPTPTQSAHITIFPILSPQPSEPSEHDDPDDSKTFSLTTPPQSPLSYVS